MARLDNVIHHLCLTIWAFCPTMLFIICVNYQQTDLILSAVSSVRTATGEGGQSLVDVRLVVSDTLRSTADHGSRLPIIPSFINHIERDKSSEHNRLTGL